MDGCERARSFPDALAMTAEAPETVVIGGARCYRDALRVAHRMYLTRIDADFPGDAWFPEWDPADWVVRERERFPPGEAVPFAYEFLLFERAVDGARFAGVKVERGQPPPPYAAGVHVPDPLPVRQLRVEVEGRPVTEHDARPSGSAPGGREPRHESGRALHRRTGE